MRYFCTYFDKNYLTRGLALYESLKKHCGEFRLDILCLDDECQKRLTQLSLPECRTLSIQDLEVIDPNLTRNNALRSTSEYYLTLSLQDLEANDPDLVKTKSSRTTVEYYFTLTPCLIRHLLQDVPEGELLTYLDSDLYFYSNPEPIFEELKAGSIGIIAHRFPKEFEHMSLHGIYNVGWVSFRNDDLGRACNAWWRKSCLEWCYDRVENGRYADQGYLDDWPERFKGTVVIQNLGANVAPWNVGQYGINVRDSKVTIDGHNLIFYHFHALRQIDGHLFDSQLSKYGVDIAEALRRYIYKPYLDELDGMDRKLRRLAPAAQTSSEAHFDLIPQIGGSQSQGSSEQANVEDYLYKKLVAAEKDRLARHGVILSVQKAHVELGKDCEELRKGWEELDKEYQITYKQRDQLKKDFEELGIERIKLENAFEEYRKDAEKFEYVAGQHMHNTLELRIKSAIINKLREKHWMKLGVLRQYEPRKMRLEQFPAPSRPVEDLPSISMVTPSYMQGHFLERTMLSVLSQEYPKMQYIVQDGGSKDDSAEIIKRHASKLAYWVSAPDKGQSDAVKCGFEKSNADVMAWLNSDDMLMPGSLRYIGEYFAAHPEVDAIYGHRVVVDENDDEIGRWVLPRHKWGILHWADYVPQETMFWRRSLWEKTGGVDPSFRFALDWDLLMKFEKAGAKVVRLPYFLGCFRTHASQKTLAENDNSYGEQEMARIRKSIHGRRVRYYEMTPFLEGYYLQSIKTSILLSMGIRG